MSVLMQQGRLSGKLAWEYFEPEGDLSLVHAEKLAQRMAALGCLDQEEITTLVAYLDSGATGQVVWDDFRVALLTSLSTSNDVHWKLSEEEFDCVMWRVKKKLDARDLSVVEVFLE